MIKFPLISIFFFFNHACLRNFPKLRGTENSGSVHWALSMNCVYVYTACVQRGTPTQKLDQTMFKFSKKMSTAYVGWVIVGSLLGYSYNKCFQKKIIPKINYWRTLHYYTNSTFRTWTLLMWKTYFTGLNGCFFLFDTLLSFLLNEAFTQIFSRAPT